MSQRLANLIRADKRSNLSRAKCLALATDPVYEDGRTKQAYKDECDINKIMARFAITDTITHLAKHQGTYADYSDYDFFEETQKLTKGREIFDDLPAEIRREFGQSPAAFFAAINKPGVDREELLTRLAKPGTQLKSVTPPDADTERAALAKQSVDLEPQSTPLTPSAPAEAT